MAVYTALQKAQIQTLLGEYDIGTLIDFQGIAQGVSNTNYHLKTSNGRYILTLFEARTNVQSLPFIFAFTSHLADAGLCVPSVIQNRAGGNTTQIAGKTAAILSFLNGADIPRESLTPAHCHAFGLTLGKMHVAAANFPLTQANPMQAGFLLSLLDATQNQLPLPRDVLMAYAALDTSTLPHAAIHADLCQDNVFFDDAGTLSGVIDFYFACTDTLIYDLSIAVNAWCFNQDNTLNPERLNALISAYESVRPITPPERAAWQTTRAFAALRMYATRQYDLAQTAPDAQLIKHDPAEYLIKMDITCDLP